MVAEGFGAARERNAAGHREGDPRPEAGETSEQGGKIAQQPQGEAPTFHGHEYRCAGSLAGLGYANPPENFAQVIEIGPEDFSQCSGLALPCSSKMGRNFCRCVPRAGGVGSVRGARSCCRFALRAKTPGLHGERVPRGTLPDSWT